MNINPFFFGMPIGLSKKMTIGSWLKKNQWKNIFYLREMGMKVYHPNLKEIVHLNTKFYIVLCAWPYKSRILSILSSCNCYWFGYTGELYNVIDNVVCCNNCYINFSQNRIEQFIKCYSFLLLIKYTINRIN